MPKKRYTEEQIVHALKQAGSGEKAGGLCRKLGISEQTFYRYIISNPDLFSSDHPILKRLVGRFVFQLNHVKTSP